MAHGEGEKQTGVRDRLQGEGSRRKQREPACSGERHRMQPPTDQFIFLAVKFIDLNVNPTVLLNFQKNTNIITHLCSTI